MAADEVVKTFRGKTAKARALSFAAEKDRRARKFLYLPKPQADGRWNVVRRRVDSRFRP